MVNLSRSTFTLVPEFSQQTTSVFSPLFSANIGIDTYFEGREEDRYATNMLGIAATHQVNNKLRLKWMASRFENDESENSDIIGAYLFGERDFDKSKPTFGQITNPLGAGLYQRFARNQLNITNWAVSHKGQYSQGRHLIQWGLTAEKTLIKDKLNEWERQDSAGYTIPFNADQLNLSNVLKSTADLNINKFSGYLQDNFVFNESQGVTLSYGVRFNYNSLNGQFLLSPRAQFSWKPKSSKDIIFKAAAGWYSQPPFYRELRRYDGTINKQLKAQNSWQVVLGSDYQFQAWGRPFRVQYRSLLQGYDQCGAL